jgi:hypothetical protein
MKTWMAGLILLAAGCSAAGSSAVQTFEFDYPESDPAPIVLQIDSGTLNVMPGAGTGVQGQVTTNVQAWQAQVSLDGDGTQRVMQGDSRNQVIPNASNVWDVSLGTGQPLALTVNHSAAAANLALGGLPLRTLNLNGTTGDSLVTFTEANPLEEGVRARVQMTNGDVSMSGVFNSRIVDLAVVTVAGKAIIDFGGGTLTQNFNSSIETRVGDVTLSIPIGTAARVMFTGASGRALRVSPNFVEVSDNVFETAEYSNDSRPHVQISVTTLAGDLTLLAVPAQ